MSNRWKIIVTIGAALALFAILLAGVAGFVFGRSRNFRAETRPPQQVSQLEVRLIDDNEDGIPDRGVLELPAGGDFGPRIRGQEPGFDAPRNFGRRFARGPSRFPLNRFSPFGIVGGLFRLAGLAVFIGAIAVGAVLFQRWLSRSSGPDRPVVDTPPDAAAEVVEPPAAEPEPTGDQPVLDTDDPAEPEPGDNRPES